MICCHFRSRSESERDIQLISSWLAAQPKGSECRRPVARSAWKCQLFARKLWRFVIEKYILWAKFYYYMYISIGLNSVESWVSVLFQEDFGTRFRTSTIAFNNRGSVQGSGIEGFLFFTPYIPDNGKPSLIIQKFNIRYMQKTLPSILFLYKLTFRPLLSPISIPQPPDKWCLAVKNCRKQSSRESRLQFGSDNVRKESNSLYFEGKFRTELKTIHRVLWPVLTHSMDISCAPLLAAECQLWNK